MKPSINNIRNAYNNNLRYVSDNSEYVKFVHAVRAITHSYYNELQVSLGDGKTEGYKFIQQKMTEHEWNGVQFKKPLPQEPDLI